MRKQNRSAPLTEQELAFRRDVAERKRLLEERELAMRNAEHFGVLGAESERKRVVAWLRLQASLARRMGPVDRGECADLLANAIERGAHAATERDAEEVYCSPCGAAMLAFCNGAAVAFGLMGMAEAIRSRPDLDDGPRSCVVCGRTDAICWAQTVGEPGWHCSARCLMARRTSHSNGVDGEER